MASLYNADLKPIASGATTYPYDHATRLFLSDNYRLAPKQSFLYYVCINVDTGALTGTSILQSLIAPDGVSSQTLIEQYEAGLMAKRVELPKFTLSTKTMNAYNRKNIIQTNISYDPVTITFHDDAADIVTNFWNDYYTYYYRDSDYNSTLYQLPHKYQSRNRDGWGFTPRNNSLRPFLRNIQIFSLHNKRFTEYLLINPFITSWRHGEHDSSRGDGIMENTMQLAYETVKYRTGYVNPIDVNGFSLLHYDNTASPISNGASSVFTDAIISGAVNGATRDLARPNGTGSGIGVLGSILNAYKFYNTAKNVNIGGVAKQVLGQLAGQIINGAVNGAINNVFFPTVNGTGGYGGTYGSSQVYANAGIIKTDPYGSPANSFLATIAGSAVGAVVGSIVQTTATQVDQWVRGMTSGQTAPLPQQLQQQVYQEQTTNGIIQVNAQGNPITGQSTAFVQNSNGVGIIAEVQTIQTGSVSYNSANPLENLTTVTLGTDSNGKSVTEYVYGDNTIVIYDTEQGGVQQIYPGTNYNNAITAPTNTRDQVLAGRQPNPGQQQTYTDPVTGIIKTVGGVTGAYIQRSFNQLPNGLTVTSQASLTAGASALGLETGRVTPNGSQPNLNNFTNRVIQLQNSESDAIQNVIRQWSNTGKYDPSSPTKNIKNRRSDGPVNGFNTSVTSWNSDGTISLNMTTGLFIGATVTFNISFNPNSGIITAGQSYYVTDITSTKITISDSPANPAINWTDSGLLIGVNIRSSGAGFIITDMTDSVTYTDATGAVTAVGLQTATNGSNWVSWGSTSLGINSDTASSYPGSVTDQSGNWIGPGIISGGGGYTRSLDGYNARGNNINPINISESSDTWDEYFGDSKYWT